MHPAPIRRHLSINIHPVRRHEGDSFARQVAYIGRTVQQNPRTGDCYNFTADDEPEATGLAGWEGDIDTLVTAATFAEPLRRSKVVEGRVAILALPSEFEKEERLEAVKKCAQHLVETFGVAVAFGIHLPPKGGDARNHHAHLLLTSRATKGREALGAKTRELDVIRTGSVLIEAFRVWWCALLNHLLLEVGHSVFIEHKSYARLGICEEPSQHFGEKMTAIWRAGEQTNVWTPRRLPEPEIPSEIVMEHRLRPKLPEPALIAGPSVFSGHRGFRPLMTPQIAGIQIEPGG